MDHMTGGFSNFILMLMILVVAIIMAPLGVLMRSSSEAPTSTPVEPILDLVEKSRTTQDLGAWYMGEGEDVTGELHLYEGAEGLRIVTPHHEYLYTEGIIVEAPLNPEEVTRVSESAAP